MNKSNTLPIKCKHIIHICMYRGVVAKNNFDQMTAMRTLKKSDIGFDIFSVIRSLYILSYQMLQIANLNIILLKPFSKLRSAGLKYRMLQLSCFTVPYCAGYLIAIAYWHLFIVNQSSNSIIKYFRWI